MKAEPGQEIEIPININNIPEEGISGFDFIVNYDKTEMTYKGFEAGSIINVASAKIEVAEVSRGLKILYIDESEECNQPLIQSGEVVRLTFELNSSFSGVTQTSFSSGWSFAKVGEDNRVYGIENVVFKSGIIFTGDNYSLRGWDTYVEPERINTMNVREDGIGDVSGDGLFNSIDYVLMDRYIQEIIDTFPVEDDYWAGDVTADGLINSNDYVAMNRVLTEVIDDFPKSRMLPTPLQIFNGL